MKTLKKLLVLLIAGCLMVLSFSGCISPKAYEPSDESLFEFVALEDGTYSVAAKEGSKFPEIVNLPKEYNEKAVTAVAENGFKGCEIVEVRIPSTIKVVGKNAFYGSTLTSVYFYKGVVEIQDGAFYSCKGITELNLPASLKVIGASAFFGVSIRNLKLTEKVETVGAYAFAYCENLSKVYISHSVSSLAETAFNGCSSNIAFEISASNTHYKLNESGFPVSK